MVGGAASRGLLNLHEENLDTSASEHRAYLFSKKDTDTSTASTQRIYRLHYDAFNFGHESTTPYITIPGRQEFVEIQYEPVGDLGLLFSSKDRAKTKGKEWLYEQLSHLNDQPTLPLPYRQDGEFYERPPPGTWRRTGWIGAKYTIVDVGRYHDRWENDYEDVSLSVTIEEEVLDQTDDGQGYKTDDADEDGNFGPGKGRVAAGIIGMQARAA